MVEGTTIVQHAATELIQDLRAQDEVEDANHHQEEEIHLGEELETTHAIDHPQDARL